MGVSSLAVFKFGALGDVVRTSYLIQRVVEKYHIQDVTWVTKSSSYDLLRFNPYLNNIICADMQNVNISADLVLSFDDEWDSANLSSRSKYSRLIGSYTDNDAVHYTDDSSKWFDMGLISKYGKCHADRLKKCNQRSHTEIFSAMLEIEDVRPCFYGNILLEEIAIKSRTHQKFVLGVNCFAGSRWKSKEMPDHELSKLVKLLQYHLNDLFGKDFDIWIFSDNVSRSRVESLFEFNSQLKLCDTSRSVLDFAAKIKACNYLISTDSLGLHLAIAQGVSNLSFYAPTSAVEIDTFGLGKKLISTADDYCSYLVHADNSTITADKILDIFMNESILLRKYS